MKVAMIYTPQRICLIGAVDGDVSRRDILVDNIHLLSIPTYSRFRLP